MGLRVWFVGSRIRVRVRLTYFCVRERERDRERDLKSRVTERETGPEERVLNNSQRGLATLHLSPPPPNLLFSMYYLVNILACCISQLTWTTVCNTND